MKKLLISLLTLATVGTVAFGATTAFFSDTETSVGNTLAAGSLDLKVDNTCYYNGNACVDGFWQGRGNIGVGNSVCSCTWKEKDLEEGDVFFDLRDLKPGDWEEDTISLHVVDNDAWACVDLDITQNIDNGCTDPETDVPDPHCPAVSNPGGLGELADELFFFFWKDDGDNVFEQGENRLTAGFAKDVLGGARWALQDSEHTLLEAEGPLVGSHTYYIGKVFCYGNLSGVPLLPGAYPSPANDNNGDGVIDARDGGFICDGSGVGNISQTDLLAGDVKFYAEQARHNEKFLCNPPVSPG